ncbi:MAG: RDD family protein [Dokdonella sp.]|nr:MAG: RDD family protein [Dokdonella sp.]
MQAANPGPAPSAPAGAVASGQLPEGGIVHAGFWRRFAAYTLDSFILMVPMLLIFGLLVYMSFRAAMSGEGPGGLIILLYFLAYIGAIVGSWLYFAKFESGANQATPGKRIMGLKVTDISGERIRFGRATGRFFGKIVTGIIPFGIGWMLAGWTGRKQALHDMMASTCVVFREVSPGKPLPTARPPMPWYGWVLNGLPILCMVIMMASYTWLIGSIIGAASTQMQDSSMSSGLPDMSGSGMPDMGGMSDSTSMNSGVDAQEQETVRNGLTPVFMEASMMQSEIAGVVDGGGECPTEERSSSNAWIESIQLAG